MEQNSKVIVQAEGPEAELTDEQTEERAELVKAIVERGGTAVFTRPHRIIPDVTVTRKVSKWKPDIDRSTRMFDIEADDGSSIALWDASYIVTEK